MKFDVMKLVRIPFMGLLLGAAVGTAHAVPVTPTGLKAVPKTTTSIALSWIDNAGDANFFNIERALLGTNQWVPVGGEIPSTARTYTDIDLVSKQKYSYRVRAGNYASGLSPWSSETWAMTVYTGKPLSSWIDVTVPRAGCDDVIPDDEQSDSRGIQCRLDLLSGANGIPQGGADHLTFVLYFPNGVYDLDETVFMEDKAGATLIGESTGGTILRWIGPLSTQFVNVLDSDGGEHDTHAVCNPSTNPLCSNCRAPGVPDSPSSSCHQEVRAAVMFHSDGSKLSTFRNFTWDGGTQRCRPEGSLTPIDPETCGYVVAFDESACGPPCPVTGCTSPYSYSHQCDGLGNSVRNLSPGPGFNDSGSAHFDSVFQNAWIGLRIGHYNFQTDQQTVRRCKFLNNDFGISIEDFNALQEYIWDSRFEGNWHAAITNNIKVWDGDSTNWAGDFRVFSSEFVNNKGRDIFYQPTGHFTFRDNVSKGSGQFLHGYGYSGTRAPQTVIHNRIENFNPNPIANPDPNDPDTFNDYAIEVKNAGTLILLDNEINGRRSNGSNRTTPLVFASTYWSGSDLLAVGNKYTIGTGNADGYDDYSGFPATRVKVVGDTLNAQLSPISIPAVPIPLDDLETLPIFTVTDQNNFQDVIDAANAAGAAIVHVPGRQYQLTSSLSIPAGSSLHVYGDGLGSQLKWEGANGGTMIRVDGAGVQHLTIQGLWFVGANAGGKATGILVERADQDQSRALVNRVTVVKQAAADDYAGIDFDRLTRMHVDLMDGQIWGATLPALGTTGYRIRGGAQQTYPMAVWSSTLVNNGHDIRVTNGAAGVKALFSSVYMEQSRQFFMAEGGGGPVDIAIQGCKMASFFPLASNVVSIENVPGNVSVVNCAHFDFDAGAELGLKGARVEQSGAAAVEIQTLGNDVYETPSYVVGPNAHLIKAAEARWFCPNGQNPSPQGCTVIDGSSPWQLQPEIGNFPSDDARITDGLSLLRVPDAQHPNRPEIPKFYDEPQAQEPHQINLDTIVMEDVLTGVLLTGGDAPTYFGPFDLVATSNAGQVDLSWRNSTSDASLGNSYVVSRAGEAAPNSFTDLTPPAGSNATTYPDHPPQDQERYYYRVVARTSAGVSSTPSNVAGITVAIKAPTSLQARNDTAGPIDLSWTNNSSIQDEFHVYRKAPSDPGYVDIAQSAPTSPWYTDPSVAEGIAYSYKVTARDLDVGQSGFSNIVSTVAPVRPPTSLGATGAPNGPITAFWTNTSLVADDFLVFRSTAALGQYTNIATTTSTTFTDPATKEGMTYYYKVKAHDAAYGESLFSNFFPATAPPNTPVNLAASPTPASQVSLTWTNTSSVQDNFRIFRASGSGGELDITPASPPTSPAFLDPAPPEGPNSYRVKAWDSVLGYSGFSNAAPAMVPLKAPTNLTATGAPNGPITLSWTDNSPSNESFRIYHSTTATGTYADFTPSPAPTSSPYVDDTAAEGTTWYYKVTAYSAAVPESARSNASAAAKAPPNRPAVVTAAAGTIPGVRVSWTDSSAIEKNYRVARKVTGQPDSSFVEIKIVNAVSGSGTTLTYDDASVAPGISYTYGVRAYHASLGFSPYRVSGSVTMPGLPSAPNPATAATGINRSQDLCWIAGANSTASDVYFGTSSSSVSSATRATTAIYKGQKVGVSWWDAPNPMAQNTTYYWRIDAVSAQGITKGTLWSFKTGTLTTSPPMCH